MSSPEQNELDAFVVLNRWNGRATEMLADVGDGDVGYRWLVSGHVEDDDIWAFTLLTEDEADLVADRGDDTIVQHLIKVVDDLTILLTVGRGWVDPFTNTLTLERRQEYSDTQLEAAEEEFMERAFSTLREGLELHARTLNANHAQLLAERAKSVVDEAEAAIEEAMGDEPLPVFADQRRPVFHKTTASARLVELGEKHMVDA